MPSNIRRVITAMGEFESPLLAPRRRWKQHGQGGTWVSDWLPHIAECVDDIAVIRSCWCDGINHSAGVCQMNTGSILAGRPSLGQLGHLRPRHREPEPARVRRHAGQRRPGRSTARATGAPASCRPSIRASASRAAPSRSPTCNTPEGVGDDQQRGKLDFLNAAQSPTTPQAAPQQTELDARIASYELAFRMQAEAPEAVDLAKETEATQDALRHGRQGDRDRSAAMCLLARRLVERGVRFVQLYHGAGSKWDAHTKHRERTTPSCAGRCDKPVAGLLKDLKARGLLDDTLVIWGGEFGRTPMREKGDGRDHNPYGFTMWMAGGGVKGGQTIGATDEVGLHAVEDRLHVHDLHATILYLMGLDNMGLVYRYKGRPERPTLNEGEAFRRIAGA